MSGAREGEQPAPTLTELVRAEQVRMLYADSASYFSTMAASATLAGILIWQKTLPPAIAALWLGFMAFHTVVRLGVRATCKRANQPVAEWRKWSRRFIAGCVVRRLTWAVALPFLLSPERLTFRRC